MWAEFYTKINWGGYRLSFIKAECITLAFTFSHDGLADND